MEQQIIKTSITLDMKKNRIRIPKGLFHTLGEPKYVQLLVNTKDKKIGIKSVNLTSTSAQPIKVSKQKTADKCYELYSCTLLNKLYDEMHLIDENASYKLDGAVFVEEKTALFSFATMKKINV